MLDFHGKGADFKRSILADVQDMMVRMLSGLSTTVASQQEGVSVSDQHRVFNFTGAGVAVTDDASNRRTNIQIPGTPIGTSTVVINSGTAAKSLSLWNGSSNNAPPANWTTVGFNDTAWTAAVLTTQPGFPSNAGNGGSLIWNPDGSSGRPVTEQVLFRHHFTLGAGLLSSGSVAIQFNNQGGGALGGGVWLNNTLIGSPVVNGGSSSAGYVASATLIFASSLLNLGGADNVLAVWGRNDWADAAWVAYTLSTVSAGAAANPYVQIQEQQTQNTDAGTFTSGAWRTRALNTITDDTAAIASRSGSQFTLPAGTYDYFITAPAIAVDRHMARLQNITASSTVRNGTSEFAGAGTPSGSTRSIVSGRFSITASTTFEVQHQCQTTHATNGFGAATNLATEVYTTAEFRKVG